MTYKDFLTGAVFTAADADLLMRQGLIVVSSEAARNAIDSPTEGMRVYRLDTHQIEQHTGSGWAVMVTATAGSYVPQLTRATLGNGQIEARWSRVGDMVTVTGRLQLGSSSSIDAAAGTLTVGMSLPFPAAAFYGSGTWDLGSATFLDSGAQVYFGNVGFIGTATEARINAITGSPAARAGVNATSPFTWSSNDSISWVLTYMAGA